jgi:hypothetical protein
MKNWRRKNMFQSHNTFLSVLSGVIAGAIVTFGLFAFRSQAIPVQAQAQPAATSTSMPTISPTPFNPGPEVEGSETGEGISNEGGFFINNLAAKLNVPVTVLESDITTSLNDSNTQAVTQGFLDQTTANTLATREASLFTTGNGFFFDIDEFPTTATAVPLVPLFTLTPTSTTTEEEVTATPKDEDRTATPTGETRPSKTPSDKGDGQRATATATPTPNEMASPTSTSPRSQELFYLP